MELATSLSWKLLDKTGRVVPASELSGKAVALFFSAHWCPPCRGFTPVLKQFYTEVKAAGAKFEIVFVSGDRSPGEGLEYFKGEHGDWLMLDYSQKDGVGEKYGVRGIPSLIVVDSSGKPVDPDARDKVGDAQNGGPDAAKSVVAGWEKLCSDWTQTAGKAVGGVSVNDAEYMRAVRLARLEGRPPPPLPEGSVQEAPPSSTPPVAEAPAAAAPAPAKVPMAEKAAVDPAAVAQLTAMGFDAEKASEALASTGGSVDAAVALLFGEDVGDPMEETAPRADGPVEVTEEAVQQLVAMGFPAEEARQALVAGGGNAENAMAILLGD